MSIQNFMKDFKPETQEFNGFYKGIVRDNNDPLKYGRVRVEVMPMFKDISPKESLPWAEPCWYIMMIPPIDSWVVIVFINGDMDSPMYLGHCLPMGINQKLTAVNYLKDSGKQHLHPATLVSELECSYPETVILRTPGRNVFMIDDKQGVIKILKNDGSSIQMLNNGDILVHAKNDEFLHAGHYVYESGEISVEAWHNKTSKTYTFTSTNKSGMPNLNTGTNTSGTGSAGTNITTTNTGVANTGTYINGTWTPNTGVTITATNNAGVTVTATNTPQILYESTTLGSGGITIDYRFTIHPQGYELRGGIQYKKATDDWTGANIQDLSADKGKTSISISGSITNLEYGTNYKVRYVLVNIKNEQQIYYSEVQNIETQTTTTGTPQITSFNISVSGTTATYDARISTAGKDLIGWVLYSENVTNLIVEKTGAARLPMKPDTQRHTGQLDNLKPKTNYIAVYVIRETYGTDGEIYSVSSLNDAVKFTTGD